MHRGSGRLLQALGVMKGLMLSAVLFAATQNPSQTHFGRVDHSLELVSLISVVSSPEKYDGKGVRLIGAFRLEFESDTLCLHQEDLTQGLPQNCVGISLDPVSLGTDLKTLEKFNGKYVLVEGTFHKSRQHEFGDFFVGAVKNISRVTLWPKPSG